MLRLRRRHAFGRSSVVVFAWIVALRLVLQASQAHADEACPRGGSWVRVEVEGAPPEFAERVLEDLRAGLAGSRVGACAEDVAGTPPLATVRVAPSAAKPTRYGIDVWDAVTSKRLVRDVDLGRVPPDGRAFAIAVAADELLRASWAELELRERKRDKPLPLPAPVQPTASPARSEPAPETNRDALGARFALEHYAHGQTQFGGDVSFSRSLASWLGVAVALGLRKGLDTESQRGRVRSSVLAAELAFAPRLLRFGAVALDVPLALRGAQASYTGDAADGAFAREHVGYALFARAGVSLAVTPGGPFSVRTSAGAGAPLRSFSASDGGERVTGMGGLELFANTGFAVEF